MRLHASLFRRALTPGAILHSRGSPKAQQTTLGSYPVPPEQELLWKNRMKAYGGFIQQTISPFQMKILWPFWHTFPARTWAKFSAYYWWWVWPGIITYSIIKKMFHDAEQEVRDKYWY